MLLPDRAAFLGLLNGLDDAEWDAPTECPAWSVKGVALHILGDDLSLLARQRDETTPGLLLYAEHHPGLDFRGLLDGFNEQWVVAAQFLSRALIVELLRLHVRAAFAVSGDTSLADAALGAIARLAGRQPNTTS